MKGIGAFGGIWQLQSASQPDGWFMLGSPYSTPWGPAPVGFYFWQVDPSQAVRVIVYETGGGSIQMQAQGGDWSGQWVGPLNQDGAAAGYWVPSPAPASAQYSGSPGGTVNMVFPSFSESAPIQSHVLAPGLFAIQSVGQARGADLSDVILDGADLSGLDLTEAIFTGASLERVTFAGSTLVRATLASQDLRAFDLTRADLTGAILEGVHLIGGTVDPTTNLSGADLQDADLSGATLNGVNLAHADLRGAKLHGADFTRADLTGTNFSGLDLSGVTMKGANLTRADLRGAKLDGTDFTGADLSGTNFSGLDVRVATFGPNPRFSTDPTHLTDFSAATLPFALIGLNWSYLDLRNAKVVDIPVDADGNRTLPGLQAVAANLTGWSFANADLGLADDTPANFSAAILVGANFAGADCSFATFEGATLGGGPNTTAATMAAANLFDVSFADAQMTGVNLAGAYFYGGNATASGATMAAVDLANAYLANLDLSNVRDGNMRGVSFDGACLVNCNFKGTTIIPDDSGRGGSFERACLQGADFTDALLAGAVLADAGVVAPAGGEEFRATLKSHGKDVPLVLYVAESGTLLPPGVTTSSTICPDRQYGPCTGARLDSLQAPTSWPPPPLGQNAAAGVEPEAQATSGASSGRGALRRGK